MRLEDRPILKVIDFGIAKVMAEDRRSSPGSRSRARSSEPRST